MLTASVLLGSGVVAVVKPDQHSFALAAQSRMLFVFRGPGCGEDAACRPASRAKSSTPADALSASACLSPHEEPPCRPAARVEDARSRSQHISTECHAFDVHQAQGDVLASTRCVVSVLFLSMRSRPCERKQSGQSPLQKNFGFLPRSFYTQTVLTVAGREQVPLLLERATRRENRHAILRQK